jgi:hypothetical protein
MLLRAPAKLRLLRDCVNGGSDCNTGPALNPEDDCWDHGTASAAILAGNESAGNSFRGVTSFTLDSFKIYPTAFNSHCVCSGTIDRNAAELGFEQAVLALDKVIVAEIQGDGGALGSISLAANKAFEAGSVVVAANGNFGILGASSVKEPANASRVLGAGGFLLTTGARTTRQSQGPTKDGRVKPDILAPTETETASNGCGERDCPGSDEAFHILDGTSGAVPYAAGAAALLYNFVARATGVANVDPGVIYALMILSGQKTDFDNLSGAGPLRLPMNGTLRWGVAFLGDGQKLEIPVDFNTPQGTLDVALWWPEGGVDSRHNDIDLLILNPAGMLRAWSLSVGSVFERARVEPATKGRWSVRLHGYSVKSSAPQRVYFAIFSRPTP